MCALCKVDSSDDGSPGCFASLRFVQGAAPLAPLMRAIHACFGWETICLHRQFLIQRLKLNTQILPLVRKAGGIFYLQEKVESTMPTTEKLKQEIADAEKNWQKSVAGSSGWKIGNPIIKRETCRNRRTASSPAALSILWL